MKRIISFCLMFLLSGILTNHGICCTSLLVDGITKNKESKKSSTPIYSKRIKITEFEKIFQQNSRSVCYAMAALLRLQWHMRKLGLLLPNQHFDSELFLSLGTDGKFTDMGYPPIFLMTLLKNAPHLPTIFTTPPPTLFSESITPAPVKKLFPKILIRRKYFPKLDLSKEDILKLICALIEEGQIVGIEYSVKGSSHATNVVGYSNYANPGMDLQTTTLHILDSNGPEFSGEIDSEDILSQITIVEWLEQSTRPQPLTYLGPAKLHHLIDSSKTQLLLSHSPTSLKSNYFKDTWEQALKSNDPKLLAFHLEPKNQTLVTSEMFISAIQYAFENNKPDVLSFLLRQQEWRFQRLILEALVLAIMHQDSSLAHHLLMDPRLLINLQIDLPEYKAALSPIMIAIEKADFDALRLMVEHRQFKPNQQVLAKGSPLSLIAWTSDHTQLEDKDKIEIIKLLISHKSANPFKGLPRKHHEIVKRAGRILHPTKL